MTSNEKNPQVDSQDLEQSTDNTASDSQSSPLEKLEEQLAEAKQESEEHKSLYMRALADAENVRKRNARELESAKLHSLEKLFKDLLPVLDSFDKAIEADSESNMDGIHLVRKQLVDLVEKHGLGTIDSVGKNFDPNLHMAIQKSESDDVETEQVKEEFAKGYTYHGRLLRPAMVAVSTPKGK